jgi:hypothetical protein
MHSFYRFWVAADGAKIRKLEQHLGLVKKGDS